MTDKNWPEYLRKRVNALDCRVGGDIVVKLFPSECERIADRIELLEEIVDEVIAGRYDDALLLTANLED